MAVYHRILFSKLPSLTGPDRSWMFCRRKGSDPSSVLWHTVSWRGRERTRQPCLGISPSPSTLQSYIPGHYIRTTSPALVVNPPLLEGLLNCPWKQRKHRYLHPVSWPATLQLTTSPSSAKMPRHSKRPNLWASLSQKATKWTRACLKCLV